MSLVVQKFGGSSVANIERIENVARKAIASRDAGHDVVVVVSAMKGETDRLNELAYGAAQNTTPRPRELDLLLSTGETVTIALLTMVLERMNAPARCLTGAQVRILTDSAFSKARIQDIDAESIREDLGAGRIVVVAGFQGVDENGSITTLGRGGSDTTAVALAAALEADECQIYTDVDGVYTTDPRVVPTARRLEQVTFEEMLELASLGSKVLQIRAVEFAGKYQVPLRVLSSFEDGPGTLITMEGQNMQQGSMEEPLIAGIAFNRDEAKLTMIGVPDTPGIATQILGPVADANIEVDMIVQNISNDGLTDFTFTVNKSEYDRALEILRRQAEVLGAREVFGDSSIVKLSLVGVGMRSHAGVASLMFKALAAEGINIQMISTSEIKISVVTDEKYLELGTRALHKAFELDDRSGKTVRVEGQSD
ncbi:MULTISPECIES: aspartate kinase [Spiribacter]|jgi:aspartate kinase|uniref:Aspartokinase n=1 Tax=Spiribacter roseus TaxID=1855875 RepID=A0ABV3RY62_9GAMM|nr:MULTISPECIES: aspartate kinase [Spiribacter]PYZ99611.1 aspartate kinase [Gammaproteobacteria bacterium 2W06]AUB78246.1 aspartate kinase [Spiribacter roseus]KAF0281566.1 aspartate kinase [Spiribacter roseus]KAF0282933.1 aspartate kinase [Spiribacter roseus]KAF0285883.1 aspartate kinase [Spiribacter sp. SSL99]